MVRPGEKGGLSALSAAFFYARWVVRPDADFSVSQRATQYLNLLIVRRRLVQREA